MKKPEIPVRFVRIKEVTELTGLSKSYIHQLRKKKLFPNNYQLVEGGSAVAWLLSDIYAWIDERIAERDASNLKREN